jgi:glycosyltransferase involved in cell wall biosynthesis
MKTTEYPLVTVLLPVYNAERFVAKSIESILKQSFEDFELLIINDGSSDNSMSVISSIDDKRIRIVENEKNLTLIPTLNKGIRLARGKYIARMDSDDIAHPDRLKLQINFLEKNPEVGLLGSSTRFVDQNLNELYLKYSPETHVQNKWKMLYATSFMHPTVIFRKDAVMEVSGYSSIYPHCEDYELWTRLSEVTKVHQLPNILVNVRKHDQNVSLIHSKKTTALMKTIAHTNISKINPDVGNSELKALISYLRGMHVEAINKKQLTKSLFKLYFSFLKKHKPDQKDLDWISRDFISVTNALLFKLGFMDQLIVLGWSTNYAVRHKTFKLKLYWLILKKYISSLVS